MTTLGVVTAVNNLRNHRSKNEISVRQIYTNVMAHESIFLGVTDFVKKLGIRVQPRCSILTLAEVACSLPRSGRQAYFSGVRLRVMPVSSTRAVQKLLHIRLRQKFVPFLSACIP